MTNAQYVPLKNPKVDLEGALRVCWNEKGGRLRQFDNLRPITGRMVARHSTVPLPTDNLAPHIRIELERFGANAYSVRPYTGKMPPGVDVAIYTVAH